MDILIEDLVLQIKQDSRYQEFVKQEQDLQTQPLASLLQEYQEMRAQYATISKYKEYIDTSDVEVKIKELKKQISTSKEIQEYYRSYHQINEVLERVTTILFSNISEQLDTSRYTL